jgi:diketogulonate reductase-like aldo/keto reductase
VRDPIRVYALKSEFSGALGGLGAIPPGAELSELDGRVVDALRGSALERAWRGTLTEAVEEWGYQRLAAWAKMRLRWLPKAGKVTEAPVEIPGAVGLGTYGWKYDCGILEAAIDAGIRLVDTSETYGFGRVYKALGPVLKGRADAFVATKVPKKSLASMSVVSAGVRATEALGRIDLFQVHWFSHDKPVKNTMLALRSLMNGGAFDGIGVCNVSVDMLYAAQAWLAPFPISTVQVRYNLIDRGVERALLPYCKDNGIRVIAYSPLGQEFQRILDADQADALKTVGKAYGLNEAQTALSWLVGKDVIPIPRTNSRAHLDQIIEIQHVRLPSDAMDYLDLHFPVKE